MGVGISSRDATGKINLHTHPMNARKVHISRMRSVNKLSTDKVEFLESRTAGLYKLTTMCLSCAHVLIHV